MYCDALNMHDNIYTHKFFQRAARGSLTILLYLIDNPDDLDGFSHLPVAERRKERAKLKKRKAKDEKDEAKALAAAASSSAVATNGDEKPKKVDSDPYGEKILQKNLLQEANNFCNLLSSRLKFCDPATLALVAEVYMRRGKLVPAARAVSCGLAQSPYHPDVNLLLVKLYRRLKGLDGSPTPTIAESVLSALSSEIASLMNGLELQAFVSNYVEQTVSINSLSHRVGASRLLVNIASHKGLPAAKQRAADLVLDEAVWAGRELNISSVAAAHKVVSNR